MELYFCLDQIDRLFLAWLLGLIGFTFTLLFKKSLDWEYFTAFKNDLIGMINQGITIGPFSIFAMEYELNSKFVLDKIT